MPNLFVGNDGGNIMTAKIVCWQCQCADGDDDGVNVIVMAVLPKWTNDDNSI